jgi:hypothetical protein
MIGAVLWAAFTKGPIFFAESIAITAFAISWLTKGEIHAPIVQAIKNRMGLNMGKSGSAFPGLPR